MESDGRGLTVDGSTAGMCERSPVAVVRLDAGGVILEIDRAGAELLGRTSADLVGQAFGAVVELVDPEAFSAHLAACVRGRGAVDDVRFLAPRGLVDAQLVSSRVDDGTPPSCRTAIVDLTEHRRAERRAQAAGRDAQRRLAHREAVEGFRAGLGEALARPDLDLDGLLLRIVDGARSLFAARSAALLFALPGGGSRWVTAGVPAREQAELRARAERLAGAPSREECKPPRLLTIPLRSPGKPPSLLLVDKGPTHGDDDRELAELVAERLGAVVELVSLCRRETRRQEDLAFLARAGAVLAESLDYEPMLARAVSLVVPELADRVAVDVVDAEGALHNLVTYQPGAAPRRQETPPSPALRAIVEGGRAARIAEDGATSTIVAPMRIGGRVGALLRLSMVGSGRAQDDDDVALAEEVAHRVGLSLEAARLYRSARQAIDSRDNLLAVVSHDLLNYVSAVRLNLDVAVRLDREGRARRPLDAAQLALSSMTQLIRSLDDADAIETGSFSVARRREDLGEVLDELSRTMAAPLADRHLRLQVDCPPDLPLVHGDRQRLLQVLMNLVGNAVKFSDDGGTITIAAEARRGRAFVSVNDEGPGIAPDDREHVFERRWRLGARAGAGLGLFIAKGIVQAHGGTIDVDSFPGHGATFRFDLPLAPEAPS